MELGHTWYEGIRACEARPRSNAVMEQQDIGMAKSNSNADGVTNFRLVFTSAKAFRRPVSDSLTTSYQSVIVSASASVTQGCDELLNFVIFTSVLNFS